MTKDQKSMLLMQANLLSDLNTAAPEIREKILNSLKTSIESIDVTSAPRRRSKAEIEAGSLTPAMQNGLGQLADA